MGGRACHGGRGSGGTMARGLLYYLPTVHLLRGQALLHLNCTADAKDALNRALQMAEEFDLALISWRALVGLAEYHDREGDQEDAKTFCRQAAALVQTISASIPDPQIVASFLSRPKIRALMLRAEDNG